jgi:hypothetical protein
MSPHASPEPRFERRGSTVPDHDDELRRMLREFRTSTAHEFAAVHRRLDALREEMRQDLRTSSTTILKAIREFAEDAG